MECGHKELNLAGNELTELPKESLASLRSLRKLNLAKNDLQAFQIEELPLNGLTALEHLNLSGNALQDLPINLLDRLPSLRHLHLVRTHLRKVNGLLASNANHPLQTLDLSDNALTTISSDSWTNLQRLRSLNLARNQLTSIEDGDFHNLSSLQHLDLSYNRLTSLASAQVFDSLSQLRSLNLAGNRLQRLAAFGSQLFASQHTSLEYLDLSDNKLTDFPFEITRDLKSIRKLFVDHNRIDQLHSEHLQALTSLDELSIAYNQLSSLPIDLFAHNTQLRLLNLHANQFDQFPLAALKPIADQLLALDLGYNELHQLPTLNFPRLLILGLAYNRLQSLNGDQLQEMRSLRHLNLSSNHIEQLASNTFSSNRQLDVLDLSHNLLTNLDSPLFRNVSCRRLLLNHNRLYELALSSFEDMHRLNVLELSNNRLQTLHAGVFDELPQLKTLRLDRNRLSTFKGEYFTSRTELTELDLSSNRISYLYPNSFIIHRQLRWLKLSDNRLTYFPSEILTGIRTLQHLDLCRNRLHSLESADFANMPSIREIRLCANRISRVADGTFVNSTQLNTIDLSNNQMQAIDSRSFGGQSRLCLDLSFNQLDHLPTDLLHPKRIGALEVLNLSHNNFTTIPLPSLRRQHESIQTLDMSANRIQTIAANSDLLVNVKTLDLSHNPLTSEALRLLLTEPKSVRTLRLVNVSLSKLIHSLQDEPSFTIEMPFLRELNMSDNQINRLPTATFDRVSLLQTLDLSHNSLTNVGHQALSGHWLKVPLLKHLHLQANVLQQLHRNEFQSFKHLQTLDLSLQPWLTSFDCELFVSLRRINRLHVYAYPLLHQTAIHECLAHLSPNLEQLSIQLQLHTLQGHLQPLLSNRLRVLTLFGKSLTRIASQAFIGWTASEPTLKLINTSISTLQPDWLSDPLPDSSHLNVYVINNQHVWSISESSLSTFDSRWSQVKLRQTNDLNLFCDCSVEPLWKMVRNRYLTANAVESNVLKNTNENANEDSVERNLHSNSTNFVQSIKLQNSDTRSALVESYLNLTCTAPTSLAGFRLVDLELNDQLCNDNDSSNVSSSPISSTNSFAIDPSDPQTKSRSIDDQTLIGTWSESTRPVIAGNEKSHKVTQSASSKPSLSSSSLNHDYNYELSNDLGAKQTHSSTATHRSNPPNVVRPRHSILSKGRVGVIDSANLLETADRHEIAPVTLTKVDTLIIGIAAGVVAFVGILMLLICALKSKSFSNNRSNAFHHPLNSRMYTSAFSSISPLQTPSLSGSGCTCTNHLGTSGGSPVESNFCTKSMYNLSGMSSMYRYHPEESLRATMVSNKLRNY